MALKSIIDIEVNDAQFKEYAALFERYQAALDKMPGKWSAQGKEISAVLLGFTAFQQKLSDVQKGQATAAGRADTYWRDMAKQTKTVATNIADTTKNLLRWASLGSVFTGILGAGSLWGIDRLALSVAATRRSSLGLGLSYGEQRAFETNYRRIVEPGSFLSSINTATHDISRRAALIGLGLSPQELQGSTADVAVRTLDKLKALADRTPDALLGNALRQRGLDQVISEQEFQRLKATGPGEYADIKKAFGSDRASFGLDPELQKKWQEFSTTLSRSGEKIENVFVKGLGGLIPGLTKLSESVSTALQSIFANPKLNDYLIQFGQGIEHLAEYIGSDKFASAVKRVGEGFDWLADRVDNLRGPSATGQTFKERQQSWKEQIEGRRIVTAGGEEFDINPYTPFGQAFNAMQWGEIGAGRSSGMHNPGNLKVPGGVGFQSFPSDEAGIRAMRDQLLRDETSHGQNTLRKLIYGSDQWPGYTSTDRDTYLSGVSREVGIAPDAPLNPSDRGQMAALISAMTRREGHPVGKEVVIHIINDTGGSAIVQASQLPQ